MPEQPAEVRRHNFEEVALGFDEDTAVEEAQRCLNCPKPRCVGGCPVNIYIPRFIHAVAERDFQEAIRIIKEKSSLPAVCGRVCPQEKQCEGQCVLGIKGQSVAIGALERFVADYAREHGFDETAQPPAEPKGKKSPSSGPADGLVLRRRPEAERLRSDHFRSLPYSRRRAHVRHSPIPSAEGNRAA